MCIRLYLEQPFCCGYFVYFCSTNGTAGSAVTRLLMMVTVPAGATTGTVSF
jgi:hypothetical protein